jgi:predicted CXXCH cytochrome family protein
MGNVVTETNVGWVSTKSERYQHVQCESCHGPGLNHVLNPDVSANKPLASLNVAATATTGCGECHSGVHRPFAEEWGDSRHANPPGSRGTNASCSGCHEAKSVLQAWGVTSNFAELATPSVSVSITCAVCHDPHNAKNPGQLRFPVDVPVLETNLCMKCHYKRAQPEMSNREPHSPQGPTLLGEAGWFPPNFEFPPQSLVGSHGTDRNPKLCATCHVSSYQVTDAVTGAFSFRATGHSFQPTPCVDAQGVPTGATDCDISERSFRSCTNGCHLTEGAARTALSVARFRISLLVTEISGLIAQIPSAEFSTTDNRISTGEGSKFNMQLAQQAGATPHNPYLVEALLLGSIRQIELDYGITHSVGLSLIPELAPR